jgi:hypothetical protein
VRLPRSLSLVRRPAHLHHFTTAHDQTTSRHYIRNNHLHILFNGQHSTAPHRHPLSYTTIRGENPWQADATWRYRYAAFRYQRSAPFRAVALTSRSAFSSRAESSREAQILKRGPETPAPRPRRWTSSESKLRCHGTEWVYQWAGCEAAGLADRCKRDQRPQPEEAAQGQSWYVDGASDICMRALRAPADS